MSFFNPDRDVEAGLESRYNHVMDLLESGFFVPSFQECVALQGQPQMKQRFLRVAQTWMLPVTAQHQLQQFLLTWNGMLDSLVTTLEGLLNDVSAQRREHGELLEIILHRR
jgi:hypothetical protein